MGKCIRFKLCGEASCNHVYVPDRTGKCPKCGSEGLWLERILSPDERTMDKAKGGEKK